MITNTTYKTTYTVIDGVDTYAIGFDYNTNPDNTPQIKLYINNVLNVLNYGVDYTLSENGLNVILANPVAGDVLHIMRDIPMVQLSDYVIGRIDPEQIEKDFDEAVMRDQQIQSKLDLVSEMPEDHETRIIELELEVANIDSLIPSETTPINKLADKGYVGDSIDSATDEIYELIPTQATAQNKLADKDFVNSSIATNTATFRGTYNSVAELNAYSGEKDNNDYAFVTGTDSLGNPYYDNYVYNGTAWAYRWRLNNSSFTAAQWAAINSNVTQMDVSLARSALQPGDFDGMSGRSVGDIFYTMRNDNNLNGAVECNGATYNTTDFIGAQSIGNLLAAGKVPYLSLADYATALATDGSVGVFGWNGAGTTAFRVPSLNDIFVETGTAAQLGDFVPAGAPNITGKFTVANSSQKGNIVSTDGCVYADGTTSGQYSSFAGDGNSASGPKVAHIDASRSSSVYSNDVTTIQPKSVRYRAMVQLAISASDEAVETCTGVLADVAALKYDYVVDFQAPTASNNYTWYRKYKSGWVEQGGVTATNTGGSSITLPVTMADTNYSIMATILNVSSGQSTGGYDRCPGPSNVTTTGFWLEQPSNANYCTRWQVSGMAAS